MYKVQINWKFPYESGWDDLSNVCFPTYQKAFDKLSHASNLSRVCAPLRVIDDNNNVILRYFPAYDDRLPGALHRRTQEVAYDLWDKAGRPECDGTEFWSAAELYMAHNRDFGFRLGNFTEEEINLYSWKKELMDLHAFCVE